MKVYIVQRDETNYDNRIVKVFSNLDSANAYAKRCILDTWRIQDGYPYERILRQDGTKCYKYESYDYDIYFTVEIYEVE